MQRGNWEGLPVSIVSEAAFLHVQQYVCSVYLHDGNACGNLSGSSGTATTNVGKNCNYWSSSTGGSGAFNWNVNSGNLNENSNATTNGLSVRMFFEGSVAVSGDFFLI
ncbi:MAG: hypothetical protein II864_07265 [Prevotella sp.]|nr:hypothetical protein [Prevotella sp.]